MDIKLFLVTFGAIFLAELGDKTQLAAMSFAAGNRHALFIVFLAASLAMTVATAIGVAVGATITRVVDPKHIKIGAGVLFILIGLATLLLPDKKREHAFKRLHNELERYLTVEQCKTCEKFQGVISDLVAHDHPELRRVLRKLHVEPGGRHPHRACAECSADRLRALFAEEHAKADTSG
jgi:hypothetical protein